MAHGRPTKAYSRRSVASYERDKEYLIRLRMQIYLDGALDSAKAAKVVEQIDGLLVLLKDLCPPDAA